MYIHCGFSTPTVRTIFSYAKEEIMRLGRFVFHNVCHSVCLCAELLQT